MKKTLAQPVNELDLFYETTLTYEKIKQVAREEKIEIEKNNSTYGTAAFSFSSISAFRSSL